MNLQVKWVFQLLFICLSERKSFKLNFKLIYIYVCSKCRLYALNLRFYCTAVKCFTCVWRFLYKLVNLFSIFHSFYYTYIRRFSSLSLYSQFHFIDFLFYYATSPNHCFYYQRHSYFPIYLFFIVSYILLVIFISSNDFELAIFGIFLNST